MTSTMNNDNLKLQFIRSSICVLHHNLLRTSCLYLAMEPLPRRQKTELKLSKQQYFYSRYWEQQNETMYIKKGFNRLHGAIFGEFNLKMVLNYITLNSSWICGFRAMKWIRLLFVFDSISINQIKLVRRKIDDRTRSFHKLSWVFQKMMNKWKCIWSSLKQKKKFYQPDIWIDSFTKQKGKSRCMSLPKRNKILNNFLRS